MVLNGGGFVWFSKVEVGVVGGAFVGADESLMVI